MTELANIKSLVEYLQVYGSVLAKKAIHSLHPLHTPGVDPEPEFNYVPPNRKPFGAQPHIIAGAVQMFDHNGGGFLVGEQGVGKTLCGLLSVHEHASRSRRKGGSNGNYRAFVLCPDHLIEKWKREIEDTIPSASVRTFRKWYEFLGLAQRPTASSAPKHWPKPEGAEWYILGRNQAKHKAGSSGLGDLRRCFDGQLRRGEPSKPVKVSAQGQPTEIERRMICPKCGGRVLDRKGFPMSAKTLGGGNQHNCENLIMTELPGEERSHPAGLDILTGEVSDPARRIPYEHASSKPGRIISHAGKKWKVTACGEPLYQFTWTMRRWPPAMLIQHKLRKFAKYLIVDESHEQKSDESAQSMAMGKILGATKFCLGLTGTFIGGYSEHVFPLLMRMFPEDLKSRGIEWGETDEFVKRYGYVDYITTSSVPVETTRSHSSRSMKKTVKLESSTPRRKTRPGVMPTLFSQLVMQSAMFLTLDEFIDGLPGFAEDTVPYALPQDVQSAYDHIQTVLVRENAELVSQGNPKLMGTMLWTLLSYPDTPWDWPPMFEGEHAVGWWKEKHNKTQKNYMGVVTPPSFDFTDRVLPKEQGLIDRCKARAEKGDQTWVYVQLTQKRGLVDRIRGLLAASGLRVGVLRAGETEPREREKWIIDHGREYDVMLSFPGMVSTGLDLFNLTEGSHNFNHLEFFQCGYNLFMLLQASRRSWRIGQPKDCTVTYSYYDGTSQAQALALMGRKARAAQELQRGTISEEGLQAMGGECGDQAALIRALGEQVDPTEIKRSWARVKSGTRNPAYVVRTPPKSIEVRMGDIGEDLFRSKDDPHPTQARTLPAIVRPEPEPVLHQSKEEIDAAASDFRKWLAEYAEDQKPPAPPKVHVPEPEDGQLSPRQIADLFRQVRTNLKRNNDDWDWDNT